MLRSIYQKLLPEKQRIDIHLFIDRKTAFFYKGNNFKCNCCNRTFRKFKPKGNVKRENAQCPYCGSLERTRLLLFYLQNETGLFTGKPVKLLHFAPEFCLIPIFKQQKTIEYYDVDINPDLATYVVNIESIPYPDNHFDYIICSHVLGHVTDEPKAIREMNRVLKPGGTALVMTLIDKTKAETFESTQVKTPEERLKFYTEQDLQRLHGMDFAQRLQEGFSKVETIDYRKHFDAETQKHYALGDGNRELIFKCKKLPD